MLQAESLVPLTKKQKAIYGTIVGFLRNKQVMPTNADLRRLTGLNSMSGVSKHLHTLSRKGWIEQNQYGRIVRIQSKGCSLCPSCGQRVVTQ